MCGMMKEPVGNQGYKSLNFKIISFPIRFVRLDPSDTTFEDIYV